MVCKGPLELRVLCTMIARHLLLMEATCDPFDLHPHKDSNVSARNVESQVYRKYLGNSLCFPWETKIIREFRAGKTLRNHLVWKVPKYVPRL